MAQVPDNLLVGTRGWDHASWQGEFYPEELPADWRLSYYATRLRCVLVPDAVCVAGAATHARRWIEDTGEQFRYLLEVEPASWPDPAAFLAATAPLAAHTAAVLLRDPHARAVPGGWLEALGARAPVCIDAPAGELAVQAPGVSRCWRPSAEAQPQPGGQFLVAVAPVTDLRTLRTWLEQLGAWSGRDRGIALIVDDGPRAPGFAQQARVAAELLGL